MKLLSIDALCEAAKAKGCDVRKYGFNVTEYAEIFLPTHEGEKYVEWHGSTYSRADIIISDGCNIGYGYNPFFYGPFHPGLCRSNSSSVEKLLKVLF